MILIFALSGLVLQDVNDQFFCAKLRCKCTKHGRKIQMPPNNPNFITNDVRKNRITVPHAVLLCGLCRGTKRGNFDAAVVLPPPDYFLTVELGLPPR